MLRSLPSAVDDALDTLYVPNAIFGQFLGSASMTFFFFVPFLASSSCLVFSCFSCLFFLSFPLSFFFLLSSLFFPFPCFLFFSLFVFSLDLRLSCVCVVVELRVIHTW